MKHFPKYFFVILFCLFQMLSGVYGQTTNNKLLKNDSTKRDKTNLVKQGNIKDTASFNPVGDTAVKNRRPKQSNKENKTMYLVPGNKKKNSNHKVSN